ncbi:ornithine decarboxylase-like isoform X2 [Dermacentor albipictus]|uniref:ornithine decarboxylase-like isoform X2 n=1 Tax=Dermacentor albipictus TaxID=60249 RepID=UPI0038FD3671
MSNTSYTNICVDDSVINVARNVIQQQATCEAFFICDVRDLEYKVRLWRREMPNVTPFFAVKCCTDLVVLRTLNSLGVNFDCSNKVEIETVMQLGVSPERIIFAHPIKSVEHLNYAKRNNVTLMTFDSADELDKIKDKNARFHIGAAFKHPTVFQRTIEDAKAVFDVGRELGFKMDTLDIGGGFPGGARKLDSFVELCHVIRDAIDTNFPPSSCINIIAEPGQFFVMSAYTLITKVVGIKKNFMTVEGKFCEHHNVYINESKCNTINRDLFELMDIHISPLEAPVNRPRDILTTIWGATCHPWDMIVCRSHFFAVSDGEWLVFDNMGAYTLVQASGFNGFGFPRVHYIASTACFPFVELAVVSTRVRSGYGHLERALEPRPL